MLYIIPGSLAIVELSGYPLFMYSIAMGDLEIKLLRDEFGQYELILKCESCLRERRTTPHMVANICGWDSLLEDVVRRMRCSVCGKKKCTARAVPRVQFAIEE
jgi:hypothetical protein